MTSMTSDSDTDTDTWHTHRDVTFFFKNFKKI